MKIEVRGPGNDAPWKQITDNQLADYCIHVCGGGYNAEQTAEAMAMQRRILDGEEFIGMTGMLVRATKEPESWADNHLIVTHVGDKS
jgi:hypothetical protein